MPPPRAAIRCCIAAVFFLCEATAQVGPRDLKTALGLSEAQLSKILQSTAQTTANLLDDSQRSKLVEIGKVLERRDAAAFAISFALMRREQWPGGGELCDRYPSVEAYAYGRELGFTEAQKLQLTRYRFAAREEGRGPRPELALAILNAGQRANFLAFETSLQLASEAIRLRLFPAPVASEILCH